jgi:hypothetical protein
LEIRILKNCIRLHIYLWKTTCPKDGSNNITHLTISSYIVTLTLGSGGNVYITSLRPKQSFCSFLTKRKEQKWSLSGCMTKSPAFDNLLLWLFLLETSCHTVKYSKLTHLCEENKGDASQSGHIYVFWLIAELVSDNNLNHHQT